MPFPEISANLCISPKQIIILLYKRLHRKLNNIFKNKIIINIKKILFLRLSRKNQKVIKINKVLIETPKYLKGFFLLNIQTHNVLQAYLSKIL
jgi:hypothetical protein